LPEGQAASLIFNILHVSNPIDARTRNKLYKIVQKQINQFF